MITIRIHPRKKWHSQRKISGFIRHDFRVNCGDSLQPYSHDERFAGSSLLQLGVQLSARGLTLLFTFTSDELVPGSHRADPEQLMPVLLVFHQCHVVWEKQPSSLVLQRLCIAYCIWARAHLILPYLTDTRYPAATSDFLMMHLDWDASSENRAIRVPRRDEL